jgi:hypothetical protein
VLLGNNDFLYVALGAISFPSSQTFHFNRLTVKAAELCYIVQSVLSTIFFVGWKIISIISAPLIRISSFCQSNGWIYKVLVIWKTIAW